jgi:CopG-like RHH_1 or ribbon-helix-helix domain, RHH_5
MNSKRYWEVNRNELAEATKQFDEPFVVDQSWPLTPEGQEQWKRASRKRGRPKVGEGFKRVSVSLEQGLLKRATALAKKRGMSRSSLVAKALEQALAREK